MKKILIKNVEKFVSVYNVLYIIFNVCKVIFDMIEVILYFYCVSYIIVGY